MNHIELAIAIVVCAALGFIAGQFTGGETALTGAILGCLIMLVVRAK